MSAVGKTLGSLVIALVGLVVYLGTFILGATGISTVMFNIMLPLALGLTAFWLFTIAYLCAAPAPE
ncbi:MAG: hypothetical protein K2Q10_05295 [Rhodospirillales bacterium]|nr:hypothetical protein [Rhodospirillales bacterium]